MQASSFEQFTGTEKYIVSADLRDAVNVSIALQRPLLVKGEPGTGKTLLAHNIARAQGTARCLPAALCLSLHRFSRA
jgi:MoxR-like ATPase